jgi:predicted SprT family Zn-dependent metalloprotease
MRKPIVFKLYPEPTTKLHCVVAVHESAARFASHLSSTTLDDKPLTTQRANGIGGCFIGWEGRQNGRRDPKFGEIHLHCQQFWSDIVMHEITHACIFWAKRIGIDPTSREGKTSTSQEERFVTATSYMYRQFCQRHAVPVTFLPRGHKRRRKITTYAPSKA